MPIYRCDNGKYRIGDGECVYTSEANAARAMAEYHNEDENHDNNHNDNYKSMIYKYKPQ